ncbi:TonB-dependent receptor [uncultured Muribaculum sp.]|uniref:TonB-dependent receptor n=1 Tax=uncultured Muribaculum sp. TaxID=1918613 RepID=UPI0025AFAA08|nr:TonB-dependent receptor [uncultured Muribaculum sp.]
MSKKIITSLIFIVCVYLSGALTAVAADVYSLEGRIVSAEDREPVEFATVRLNTLDWAVTDSDGKFRFPKLPSGKYQYEVAYLGFETAKGEFEIKNNISDMTIRLSPSSLALKEVVVTAREGKMGSSSLIGQSAIQHLQAKSVEDMLQLLPGAVTKNPDLTNAGQASIREIDAGENSNNSLGTAVVVDGSPLSNDANMQVFSTARSGSNSSVQTNTMNDQTTSGRGVDLRQISPDNIESIEVVRGIPSVEYGNLTSGAVIINTKAGATPWEVLVKVDPNSKLLSFGKGLRLGGNKGSVNFAVDYTKSNADRRKTYLGYDRLTANVSYSKMFFQSSNPLSFNFRGTYYRNISDTKSDEAMLKGEYFKNEDQGVRLAVNGMWRLNNKVVSNLNYSASLQYAHQQDIYNKSVGSGVVPYSHSYLPGEMQVSFLPGSYMCHYVLDGKPINVFAQLKANRMFIFPKGTVNFKLGIDYTLSANKGGGMVYDHDFPPIQGDGQSVRPRSYESLPSMHTLSAFVENHTEYSIGTTVLSIQPGVRVSRLMIDKAQALRGDINAVDPRVNVSYKFLTADNNHVFDNLSLVGGYGLATKMPTMAYLYPTPAYFDFVSYNSYAGADNPRNLAVMTTFVVPNTANHNLKPACSKKFEIGLNGRVGRVLGSITFFKENIDNEYGFQSVPISAGYNRYVIPQADMVSSTIPSYIDGALHYTMADGTVKKAPAYFQREVRSYSMPANVYETDKHGIEYTFNFGKIKPLSTDLIIDGAWFWIKRRSTGNGFNSSRVVTDVDPASGITNYNTYLAVMPAGSGSVRSRVNTNFRFVTHIPAIRLILSTTLQVVWQESVRNIYEDADGNPLYRAATSSYGKPMLEVIPVGYYDKEMNYFEWNPSGVERPEELVTRYSNPDYFTRQDYPVTCMLNFKLTKEIKKYVQISMIANNFLKFSKVYRQNKIGGYKELYSPMYFGAEIKAKF